jgi:outer membrane protein assembly factor BamA
MIKKYISHFFIFRTKVLLLSCIWWYASASNAQKDIILHIKPAAAKNHNLTDTYIWSDTLTWRKTINDQIAQWQAGGFIYAHCDTIYMTNDTCHAMVWVGDRFKWRNIKLSPQHTSMIEASGIKTRSLNGFLPDSARIYSTLKTIVSHYANNGYPFAAAHLDSIIIEEDGWMEATLDVMKGKLIRFDSIVSEGRLVVSKHFMKRLLDINTNDTYDHGKVLRAGKRISDLAYASQREAPYLRFINDKASLVISPDPKPASRFDFLIGVLPQVVNGVRKWNITGDFTAEMVNILNQGEYFYFQFKRLRAENLELNIKASIPYLAGLPAGSHLDFRMFKNSDKNLDIFFDGGIQYLFGGFNNVKLFGSYRSSVLLNLDTEQIKSSGMLPQNLDISYTGVGLGLNLRQLDYRFNPSKGYESAINVVAGTKKIIPNRQIIDIEGFANSYDSLKIKTLQLELSLTGSYYIPLKKWATLRTALTGAMNFNQQKLRPNELLRIGGNKILRGFDEESILTDRYIFGTLEFRILFDQNSFLTLPFIDYGITRVFDQSTSITDQVFGIGMGLNFGTPAGIFNLSFAAGKNSSIPLDFGKMKIHFGYVNLF